MVVAEWSAYKGQAFNASHWPSNYTVPIDPDWLNSTAVDDLFGFGEKYYRRPPVFAKIPEPYNTITNYTSWPRTSDSFYVLATSADSTYFMCSMRAYLSPNCSTRYHASMTGGTLASHCEDPGDPLAYSKFVPDALRGHYIKDWADVAAQWGIALSLNTGISEGDSSNARLLTQLIPTGPNLTPTLPSIAEGLAVLAGSTLLFSGIDAPFVLYWDNSFPFLDPQGYQTFNATVRSQDNSSGGIQRWQDLFYVICEHVVPRLLPYPYATRYRFHGAAEPFRPLSELSAKSDSGGYMWRRTGGQAITDEMRDQKE